MVQTQLASMYLGNPLIGDAESRLKGVSSQLNSQIHILDNQSNQGIILDYITAKNIIEDNHKKSLEDTLETYDFITFADKRFSQYLEKRNRIIIPDEDGSLVEFVIFEAAKYKDTEGYKAQVFSHASYLELKKARVIYPDNGYTANAGQHGGRVLNDTGWQIGMVEGAGTKTLTVSNHTNPYEMLKRIAREFKLELRFRVEHNGNQITGRYVDMLERVGVWQGREVEFGKDLDSIRRTEKQDIVTALLGLGPERDDGTRIEVLVEDDEALQRWGRVDEYGNLNHLIEHYEIQSERQEMTLTQARQYTRTALNKRINEHVEYETTIVDLEHVPGMQNKKIRFGDTIKIKDTKFNPPLYLEARVFEQNRSIKSQAKKYIKLGDYQEFTEEEVNALWTMLRREIRKKIDIETLQEYAEPKKIESDTPPEIKDGENPIWIDTSKTPKVSNVVIGGQWQKMTPTTPQEVDAYTKQQVDSKANSTLTAAKNDATAKAIAAQEAAERVAIAQAELAETEANAYADGIVSDEEARAIQDAENKLEEAKIDATSKAAAAENAAKTYASLEDNKVRNDAQGYADTAQSNAEAEARARAAQALADAQAFARNASNINSGVIDVGAIPLRTSITGARLEWDGINGLVQYDSSGNPVSWIDLEANAYFSNAFLSGRIEALEGYFGKNKRVTIGDNGLTIQRPDGAIWMQDGLVKQDFAVTGYDPYLMDEIRNPSGTFPAFLSGIGAGSYYTGRTSEINGTESYATDIRDADKGYTVNFQRYQFMHSARYFVIRLQVSNRTNGLEQLRARLYEGDTNHYGITISNFGTWDALVVDLGTPNYEQRNIDLRIGFLNQWRISGNDSIVFRISRVYLTDYLD